MTTPEHDTGEVASWAPDAPDPTPAEVTDTDDPSYVTPAVDAVPAPDTEGDE